MLSATSPSCSKGGGDGCLIYEFIGILYNDWLYGDPIVVDVLGATISALRSCEGKLGLGFFPSARVILYTDSTISSI
jgi:hypothetical protein